MTSLDVIGLVGATIIFTWSPLFKWARKIWPAFLECPLCVGFWVGLAGAFGVYRLDGDVLSYFFTACAVSVLAFTTSSAIDWLQTPKS